MSDDVLITPGSRKIEFKDSSANVDAKIETDSSGNLIITNTGGDITIGDTTSDIFVGDGTANVDIVFEQAGEIRGTTGVTVTLGASDSNIRMATDLNLNSNNITNVNDLTITGNLTITGDINSYNVTDLDVSDKTITLGVGQIESNSGDSGIIIAGSNANLLWDEANNYWETNKGLFVNGEVGTHASFIVNKNNASGDGVVARFENDGVDEATIRFRNSGTGHLDLGIGSSNQFILKVPHDNTVGSSYDLTFDGTKLSVAQVGVTNIVTNKVVKYNGTILDDSNITDTGSLITLGSNTTVSGTTTTTQLDLRGQSETSNLDTVGRGLYYWGSTQPTTGSPGFNYGMAWTVRDPNQNIQLAFGSSSAGRLAVRRADSGTYYDWTHFYGEGTTISGDVSSSYNQTTNTLTLTVADDSHNHIISNVDGLQSALDAKAPLASPSFTTKITTPQIHHTGAISVLNGSAAQGMKVASIYAGTSYSNSAPSGMVNALNGFQVGNTTVIDSSRNISNIGTISTTGQITISGTSPQMKFNDTDGDDFWIHCNSDRFYVLADRDDSGSWETPYPLELNASTNIGYIFAQRAFTEAYHPNADKWTTARTITLGGDLTGNVSIDGSANVTLTAAVVDDSHNHVISNVDGLQTALDAKLPLAGGTMSGDITMSGNDMLGASKITLNANPTGTSYGGTSSATPANMISQVVGGNDGWRLYGEGASNDVQMIFEIIDDLETGDTWIFRNKKTYTDYTTRNEFIITGEGTFKSRGVGYVETSQRVFADNYHPNADKWTTARTLSLTGAVTGSVSWDGSGNASITTTATSDPTLTLSGDASGSATFTNLGNATLSVAVNDDSHNHVISNIDNLQTTLDGKTSLDHIRSLGTQAFTGTATTAGYISEMESDGAFDSYSSVFKTSWSYAGNFNISDAGTYGPTETAGMAHLCWTDNSSDSARGNITVLAIAPNTGGSGGRTFIYNDQGSGYNPGWREIWTSRRMGSGTGLDADKLDAQEGSYYLNYNNFTNTPTIPTNNNQLTNGSGYITSSGNTSGTAGGLSGTPNITVGTISSGAISSEGNTHYLGGIKIAAENLSQNYIAFAGTTGDAPGEYSHSYIGERIWSGTEKSELVVAKFNDVGPTSGPDRVRLIGNELIFDTFSGTVTPANDASLSTAVGTGTISTRMTIGSTGIVTIGDGSNTAAALQIKAGDDDSSDHLQFYNGSTRVGEIGTGDDSWLRINQTTAKNIYTPRYFRADGGLFVNNTNYGIDTNGRLTDASLSGTYSNSLTFSGTSRFNGDVGLDYAGAPNNSKFHVSGGKMSIVSTDNSYGQLQIGNTTAGEVSIGFMGGVTESTIGNSTPTSTYKWAAGINVYGCGANSFGIGNAGDAHEVFRLDAGSKMVLGHDGDNPQIKLVYDDNHANGDRWDTIIDIGRLQDKHNGNANYPTYQTGNGYGMYMQSNSDGCFFGMEEYTTGHFRPVIAWGDDTTDSPFFIRYNNTAEFAFTYNGVFHADDDIIAFSTTTSDARYKDNVSTIENALDKVQKLRGVEFDWNATSRKGEHDIGFIAQEIEQVIPEVVSEQEMLVGDFEGKDEKAKTVAYGQVTALLVEAIKEQQETINKLIDRIDSLEKGE